MPHTAVCVIVKDESLFLKEWIYYHYMIGFEKFILFNNDSSDNIYGILHELIFSNIVDIYDISGNHIQEKAYTCCIEMYKGHIDWIAFIDVDEFIVMQQCLDIRIFLSEYADYAGLSLHWKMFGSSGHISRPKGLVVENYTNHLYDHPGKFQVKSIVRPDLVAAVQNPHIFGFKKEHYGVDEQYFPASTPHMPYTAEKICVHHYFYKSQQDYEEKIAKRKKNSRYPQRTVEEFYAHLHEKQQTEIFSKVHINMLYACLKNNTPCRYIDICSDRFKNCEFYEFSDVIYEYIKNKHISEAHIAIAATRKKFKELYEYTYIKTIFYMEYNDFFQAKNSALQLVQKSPSLQSYYMLYTVYKYFGKMDSAERIKVFMQHAAPLYAAEEQELSEKVKML